MMSLRHMRRISSCRSGEAMMDGLLYPDNLIPENDKHVTGYTMPTLQDRLSGQ